MSRIPRKICASCNKVLYRTEEAARAALGRVMRGHWKGRMFGKNYALGVYRCGKMWHIGHNPVVIRAMEEWRERGRVEKLEQ